MAIRINGTNVINDSRGLENITNLKTIGGQSILGSGNIAAGGPNKETLVPGPIPPVTTITSFGSDLQSYGLPEQVVVYTHGFNGQPGFGIFWLFASNASVIESGVSAVFPNTPANTWVPANINGYNVYYTKPASGGFAFADDIYGMTTFSAGNPSYDLVLNSFNITPENWISPYDSPNWIGVLDRIVEVALLNQVLQPGVEYYTEGGPVWSIADASSSAPTAPMGIENVFLGASILKRYLSIDGNLLGYYDTKTGNIARGNSTGSVWKYDIVDAPPPSANYFELRIVPSRFANKMQVQGTIHRYAFRDDYGQYVQSSSSFSASIFRRNNSSNWTTGHGNVITLQDNGFDDFNINTFSGRITLQSSNYIAPNIRDIHYEIEVTESFITGA